MPSINSSTTIFHYSGAGTRNATYTYTAASTGTVVLEFGFQSGGNDKIAYLDDVSIVDTSASNSEMLVNGDFENGTLVGWQALCTGSCLGGTPGTLTTTSCNTGFFCYADSCRTGMDFVRQKFATTVGHVYILTFWLQTDNTQSVYVSIF